MSRGATSQLARLFRRWLGQGINPQRRPMFEHGMRFAERGERPDIVRQNTFAGAGWSAGMFGLRPADLH